MIPRFHFAGDRALMLTFSDRIDPAANARLIGFAERLREEEIEGVTDIVPTYGSLLICYEPEHLRGAALETLLRRLWRDDEPEPRLGRLWEVPCVYGGEIGLDMDTLAASKGLTGDEFIALHAGAKYRVYMIGFAPGFTYLGGLPELLHTPRLPTPRQNILAGAIGIGGQQASINSVAGPSGWHFVGWTPWRSFDPKRADPFLFRAGDHVRFRPVEADEAKEIARRITEGTDRPEPVSAEDVT